VKEARYYRVLKNKLVQCTICPRKCVIKPSEAGFCRTRVNMDGKLYSLVYGVVSSIAIDPVEKKPLFHFYPGSPTLSISTIGCTFRCPWCQNWHISQADATKEDLSIYDNYSPEDIIEYARRTQCPSVSITYNEPIVWLEYSLDVAKLAKENNIMTIFVTNGYASDEVLDEIASNIHAANVDIKCFKEETYRKYIKGDLKPVLEFTEYMKKKGVHTETTYLIIPGLNDSNEEIRQYCKWHYEHLGPETPLHFSRFYPQYKYTEAPPTPIETLERAWKIAKEEGLYYVYLGNVPGHSYENTYCPECGKEVIGRYGFYITKWNLDEQNRCKFCGAKIHITGEKWKETPRYWWFL